MNLALKLYKIHEKYTKNVNMIHTYHLLAKNYCLGLFDLKLMNSLIVYSKSFTILSAIVG